LAFKRKLIGIILTGANNDGSNGIKQIKHFGGHTIAQLPASAEVPIMPQSAIDTGCVDKILSLEEITGYIISICH
jgi:two-component system chemotaxis response regulator CheB